MNIDQAIKDFFIEVKAEGVYARSTLRTYSPNLNGYVRWINATPGAGQELHQALGKEQLKAYITYLRGKPTLKGNMGLRPRTIRSASSALNALSKWLMVHPEKLLTHNAAAELVLPKKDAADRKCPSHQVVLDLLDATKRLYPVRRRTMVSAMMSVMCCCGLRRFELLALKVEDVLEQGRSILIKHGKGDKRRTVLLPLETREAMEIWLRVRSEMNCSHNYLWAENRQRRIADQGIRAIFAELAQIAGHVGNPNINVHPLRRACATNMMVNNVPLTSIQAQLGHSQAITTLLYLQGSDELRRESVEQTGWLNGAHPLPVPDKGKRRNTQPPERFRVKRF
jgi:integrase/recombinase XerD